MGTLMILMQIAAYVLFALAAFLTLCGFGLAEFQPEERGFVIVIDLVLVGTGVALLMAPAHIGI